MELGPFKPIFSFSSFKQKFEELLDSENTSEKLQAKHVLEILKNCPQLELGTESIEGFDAYKEEINQLMSYLFPSVLSNNEIKAAVYPYTNDFIYTSKRFKKIKSDTITDFSKTFSNLYQYSEEAIDLLPYAFILNMYYGYNVDFSRPKQITLEEFDGRLRTYRVTFNADFIKIYPNSNAIEITPEILKELLVNTYDISLWHKYFPTGSWTIEGFSLISLIDTTQDEQINQFKTSLIQPIQNSIEKITSDFRKIFNIDDLQVGSYRVNGDLLLPPFDSRVATITLLFDQKMTCKNYACSYIHQNLFIEHKITVIPSVDNYHQSTKGNNLSKTLLQKNIKSTILIPIVIHNKLEYIIELAAYNANQLNAINVSKLESLMPFILSHAERSLSEYENQISAVIQNQCTSIHPSVEWKFIEEAIEYLEKKNIGEHPVFKEVVFNEVLPLFGQIDIVGSSIVRNKAIKLDLIQQLSHAKSIFNYLQKNNSVDSYKTYSLKIDLMLIEVNCNFNSSTEQKIHEYFKSTVFSIFKNLLSKEPDNIILNSYFKFLDYKSRTFYIERKKYDDTVDYINKKLALFIEKKQLDAQLFFPHFFEMFKTDGVEHNMYVGQSITKNKKYNPAIIKHLRFWQLEVMCQMEGYFYEDKVNHSVNLDVASLILAYDIPINIRYKIDEKQFDVDGAYNVRYEMIKKRIDKVHIKNTTERLTQSHKLSVVYSSLEVEREYLSYFKTLSDNHIINNNVEKLELEELSGASGIKALRVTINQDYYHTNKMLSLKNNIIEHTQS